MPATRDTLLDARDSQDRLGAEVATFQLLATILAVAAIVAWGPALAGLNANAADRAATGAAVSDRYPIILLVLGTAAALASVACFVGRRASTRLALEAASKIRAIQAQP